MQANPLDRVSIPALYVLTVALFFVVDELGYRFGLRYKARTGGIKESLVGANLGILLGLLSFMVAFFVGMAASRFDTRLHLVLADANSIGTTALRAELLPEPYAAQVQGMLREYVDVRAATSRREIGLPEAKARSEQLLEQIWEAATAAAEVRPTPITASFIQSLNETIDINSEVIFSNTTNRMPVSTLLIVYLVATISFLLLGFHNSLHENRNLVSLTLVVAVFSMVILLIFDLDRPRDGLLQISHEPLLELQTTLHRKAASVSGPAADRESGQ